jgi:hypothetical protein
MNSHENVITEMATQLFGVVKEKIENAMKQKGGKKTKQLKNKKTMTTVSTYYYEVESKSSVRRVVIMS